MYNVMLSMKKGKDVLVAEAIGEMLNKAKTDKAAAAIVERFKKKLLSKYRLATVKKKLSICRKYNPRYKQLFSLKTKRYNQIEKGQSKGALKQPQIQKDNSKDKIQDSTKAFGNAKSSKNAIFQIDKEFINGLNPNDGSQAITPFDILRAELLGLYNASLQRHIKDGTPINTSYLKQAETLGRIEQKSYMVQANGGKGRESVFTEDND